MRKKYYVVIKGRRRGIYDCWEECRCQVEDYYGAVYRGFETLEDAVSYIEEKMTEPECYYLNIHGIKELYRNLNDFINRIYFMI